MANPWHLFLLRRGVRVWNGWRKRNRRERPDLSGADLREADLRGAALHGANLRGAALHGAALQGVVLSNANLSRAALQGANLSRAVLHDADLSGADLTGAILFEAALTGTDLREADLTGADLHGAILRRVDLTGAVLTSARLGWTMFGVVDLQSVQGLDHVVHGGPSTIGLDTIERSHGQIPEAFLRGCGVSDRLIEYIPSLTARPIDYYSCFISYASKDDALARRLHADLQANGVRCWFAPHDLPIGARIRVGIDEAIRLHDKLLLILSKHSVASEWVGDEVEAAIEKGQKQKREVLFPIRCDTAVMKAQSGWAAKVRRSHNIGDFCQWKEHDKYAEAFKRLLRDLRAGDATG